ncbi:MAG: acyl-CoA thioesterase [Alphaproteobacteria bacterium]|nr:acyl-CoA thioesterase [Alphaproteobacteria bacterium]
MNLWLRLLWLILTAPFRPRLVLPQDVSRLRLRVWPNDLDTNLHMNNGRYFTVMDLGRMDLIFRTGSWAVIRKRMWAPVLGAAKIRYRMPLDVFQPFDLETRVLCWDDQWFFFEQRFVLVDGPKAGAVAAIAILRGGFYDSAAKRPVPSAEALEILGISGPSPVEPAHITEWKRAEAALKDVTA